MVDPRYFTDEHDVRVMTSRAEAGPADRRAVRAERLGAAPSSRPGRTPQPDDELLDYIHKTHNTVYHPSCTVKMGAADDPGAPLDPRLRVKGVGGCGLPTGRSCRSSSR